MRTTRKSYSKQYTQYDCYNIYGEDNDGNEINEYQFAPSFEPYHRFNRHNVSCKKSRLSLDEQEDFCEDDVLAYRKERRHKTFVRQACDEVFKCRQCRRFIGPPPSGGRQRNHCPFCLYSLHVDGNSSGDRRSTCGSRMKPIGSFQRVKGEHVLVHRCLGCGFERFNRIAADDDFDLVLALPVLPARTK